jgi:hypothetical protein
MIHTFANLATYLLDIAARANYVTAMLLVDLAALGLSALSLWTVAQCVPMSEISSRRCVVFAYHLRPTRACCFIRLTSGVTMMPQIETRRLRLNMRMET